jgi:beta-galactosidase
MGRTTGGGHTHAAFRFHAERLVRAIAARYLEHPAVLGVQVDNEPGLRLFHNHGVFQRFVDHLRSTYGTVEALNKEWGLVYWSHRLSTWAALWTPDGNLQPQYSLAWRRFQARQTTEFIAWQADVVREYTRPDQFVTTCIDYGRPAMDDDELTERLDVTAGNAYYEMQDGLALPDVRATKHGVVGDGTWALYQRADRMWSSRQEPFLVTETNAGSILAPLSRPAYDGQWRQAAWALVSRGARMVEYWHWRTTHAGTETSWGGVLPHSGRPGRAYHEIVRIGEEFERAGALVTGVTPDADVTLVYSAPTKWLMQEHPPLAFDAFYRGAFDAGLQTRIVHARQLVEEPGGAAELTVQEHPVLIVPGLYVSDEVTLDWLRMYAESGGHLVLGPRTGYADEEARARGDVQPARLAEAAGVWYDEVTNLLADVPVVSSDRGLQLEGRPQATRWLDSLVPNGATVLARYEHPHYGQWAAVTTHATGRGRITCLGTLPNLDLAKAVMSWLGASQVPHWCEVPETVTSTGARAADGRRLRFLHNWSFTPVDVRLPVAVTDATGPDMYQQGDSLSLGAWDVRVLVEPLPAATPTSTPDQK